MIVLHKNSAHLRPTAKRLSNFDQTCASTRMSWEQPTEHVMHALTHAESFLSESQDQRSIAHQQHKRSLTLSFAAAPVRSSAKALDQ